MHNDAGRLAGALVLAGLVRKTRDVLAVRQANELWIEAILIPEQAVMLRPASGVAATVFLPSLITLISVKDNTAELVADFQWVNDLLGFGDRKALLRCLVPALERLHLGGNGSPLLVRRNVAVALQSCLLEVEPPALDVARPIIRSACGRGTRHRGRRSRIQAG